MLPINVPNTIRRLDHSRTYTLDDIVATSLIREVATKSKRVNWKGSKKKNRKMTIQSHPNPQTLDEESLLVGAPQVNESTVGSSRPSGPHQCSADAELKVKP